MRYWEQHEYSDAPEGPFSFGPVRRRSSVVRQLIIVNAVVYLAMILLRGSRISGIWEYLSLSPADVFERGMVWQLLTYAFLHGDFFHIFFNMYILYMFGREVEATWGRTRFLAFYLGAAAFSGLCFCAVHYALGEIIPAIGASGAIMGVTMVYALWWPNRLLLFMFFIPMRMRTFAILVVIIETFAFLQGQRGVANMAHLGGLLFGFLIVKLAPVFRELSARHAVETESRREREQRRVDELLDKVHRKGMQSLWWWERNFLKKQGRR